MQLNVFDNNVFIHRSDRTHEIKFVYVPSCTQVWPSWTILTRANTNKMKRQNKLAGYPNLLTLTAILIEMLCKKVDNLQGNKGSDKL